MQQEIEQKLNSLVGLQCWAIGRAASLVWLQFGDRRVVAAHKGGHKEVGAFALHIDCPWSWRRNNTLIANQHADLAQLKKLVSKPIFCQSVHARNNGSFELEFANGATLTVAVEADADQNADEYWRLFEPSLNTAHFVVGSKGFRS